MKRLIYLTKDEETALSLLSQGAKLHTLQQSCTIPTSGIWFFTSEIRRKTGINDTKDWQECQRYMRKFAESMEMARPSEKQVELIRMLLARHTYEGISFKLEIPQEQIATTVEDFNKRAGIFTAEPKTYRAQWRIYLAVFHTSHLRALNTSQLDILRHLADGAPYAQIADDLKLPVESVRLQARDACARLGLSARGRNTQRQLIRAYLDAQEATQVDPALDPMADDCF